MNSVERAASYFDEGCNCSQALLSAYGPQFGLSVEAAQKISAAFGGGMGRLGEVCGAVTGAFMVLGLKAGDMEADNRKIKEQAYRLANEFSRLFHTRNGSIICRVLLGCDLNTPEGLQSARDRGLFTTHCTKFVRDAAEIVSAMLEQYDR